MSIGFGFGIAGFPFSSAEAFLDWIDVLESHQADSVWFSERLVSPTPTLEPMAAMAVVAGRTRKLKFGMNAIVVSLRDPLVLAKECATLDYLSGGRLLPVFGVGDERAPEWRATNRDPRGRGPRSDEALELMRRLWSEERVSFEGRYYTYTDATIAPRPVQRELPLWIGGSSEAAVRRTARIGTGWLAGLQTPAQVAPVVKAIKSALVETGRTIDEDHYGAGFSYRFGSRHDEVVQRQAAALSRLPGMADPWDYIAVGDAPDVAARVQQYIDAGVSKFVLRPIASTDEELTRQTIRFLDEVAPKFSAAPVAG